jgi:hypothetical protein
MNVNFLLNKLNINNKSISKGKYYLNNNNLSSLEITKDNTQSKSLLITNNKLGNSKNKSNLFYQ